MTDPLITFIVPVLNRRTELEQMLISVRVQTYHNYEILVIDNGSTDGSLDYAKKQSDCIVLECTKRGAAFARNVGFDKAKGEWLVILDSDNKLAAPDSLQKIVDNINTHGNNCGGLWFMFIDDHEQNITNFHRDYHCKKIGVEGYLKAVSGEVAHVLRTSWMKLNHYPEVTGARIEFAEVLWLKLSNEEGIVLIPEVVQIYGTEALNRTCAEKVYKHRARELYIYNQMLREKFGDIIGKYSQGKFTDISYKEAIYGRASSLLSRLQAIKLLNSLQGLPFLKKSGSALVSLLPAVLIRVLLTRFKQGNHQ